MSRRTRKKRQAPEINEIELNIMPFIDIFSLLNTFLLFTATFVSIGLLKVQVPFLSNATPDKPPARSLDINVDVSKNKIVLRTAYTTAPTNRSSSDFSATKKGIKEFHEALLALKEGNPKEDKLTLYSEDDVRYTLLVEVLDAIKIDTTMENEELKDNNTLFPKVVMGSVML